MKKRLYSVLAYVVPSFVLGYVWHLVLFGDYYKSLEIYRAEIILPFGILSMLIQGMVWSITYEKLFAGETVTKGALKFGAIAIPLVWAYSVLAVAAKHRMFSVLDFIIIESAFTVIHYSIFSPLVALVYSRDTRHEP